MTEKKFALLICQTITEGVTNWQVTSQNQGVGDADVILIVETWLEQVKSKYKKNFQV